jgi:hypothetical protein
VGEKWVYDDCSYLCKGLLECKTPFEVFAEMGAPLPLLKPMAQSRRGVTQCMEVQAHPLTVAIPRFIQLGVPLPPLKPMAQSRRGATGFKGGKGKNI